MEIHLEAGKPKQTVDRLVTASCSVSQVDKLFNGHTEGETHPTPATLRQSTAGGVAAVANKRTAVQWLTDCTAKGTDQSIPLA